MEIIYWLIPLSIIILVGAVYLFFWAVKDGQFDDLDSPAVSILLDDDSYLIEPSCVEKTSNQAPD